MDRFMAIGNIKTDKREGVSEREPDKVAEKPLPIAKSDKKLELKSEISTKEELYNLLEKTRKEYQPYLKDFRKIQETGVVKTEITEFIKDGETVKIPDYAGPVGNSAKIYEKTIEIEKKKGKHYCIFFKAVDYIAFVYLNGECVGTHEGFFSPFRFDITDFLLNGKNRLKVVVKNDFTFLGNEPKIGSPSIQGDKMYACTGLGWDDPYFGWHHCPPGSGISDKVYIEEYDDIFISDLFIRVLPDFSLEAWVEVYNFTYTAKPVDVTLSVYGKNFSATIFENQKYDAGNVKIENRQNLFKIPFKIENPRLWNNSHPWLYKAVATAKDGDNVSVKERAFGVRTFFEDVESEIKGAFYLNGEKIKLRGANTMGFEQQDVINGDYDQLIDDILLAKLCNINFLRITQRPVEEEIYDYCDMLGLMVQTDLPLFGVMRRTKFAEGIRQAEEMERLARPHPSCILDSFINEPFKDAHGKLHRHFSRPELEVFFDACADIIKFANPERVIKTVDGDCDPPSRDLPDTHCYVMWYNNHNVLFGKMNKGYWLPIKKGWYYGCGEFGAEGLDSVDLMKRRYPKEWIAEPFNPDNILYAQTGKNYCVFYPEQNSIENWVKASREYQAYVAKVMTEFFRRDRLCVSFAIHLFIDAFPAGWMKAIMDCERNPKPAYFAYRNALKPVLLSLRYDRFSAYVGDEVKVDAYLCNDLPQKSNGILRYSVEDSHGKTVLYGEEKASCPALEPEYLGTIKFTVPMAEGGREKYTLKAEYVDDENTTSNEYVIEFFEKIEYKRDNNLEIIELKDRGDFNIKGNKVKVFDMFAGGVYFIETPEDEIFGGILKKDDLHYLYNAETDMVDYSADNAFTSEGFIPLIVKPAYSGVDMGREEMLSYRKDGDKITVVTTINLREENPAIGLLLKALHENLRKNIDKQNQKR